MRQLQACKLAQAKECICGCKYDEMNTNNMKFVCLKNCGHVLCETCFNKCVTNQYKSKHKNTIQNDHKNNKDQNENENENENTHEIKSGVCPYCDEICDNRKNIFIMRRKANQNI